MRVFLLLYEKQRWQLKYEQKENGSAKVALEWLTAINMSIVFYAILYIRAWITSHYFVSN